METTRIDYIGLRGWGSEGMDKKMETTIMGYTGFKA